MAKQKYVRIHSQKTIQVTCGLQNKDVTNPDAHVADRLKISPSWPRCSIIISEGSHLYPSEIAEWKTVKALTKDKVITIGEFTDNEDKDDKVDVKTMKTTLVNELKMQGIVNSQNESKEQKKLADIAGE